MKSFSLIYTIFLLLLQQEIPVQFWRSHGCDKFDCKLFTLEGPRKDGKARASVLRLTRQIKCSFGGLGWRSFCAANKLKVGDMVVFMLSGSTCFSVSVAWTSQDLKTSKFAHMWCIVVESCPGKVYIQECVPAKLAFFFFLFLFNLCWCICIYWYVNFSRVFSRDGADWHTVVHQWFGKFQYNKCFLWKTIDYKHCFNVQLRTRNRWLTCAYVCLLICWIQTPNLWGSFPYMW